VVSGFGSIFGLKRVQPEFSKGTRGLGKGPTYHANVNRELAWGVHGWTFVLRAVHNTAKPQSESMAMAESVRGIALETEGKYSVELFKEGGEAAGQEEIIDRHDNLTVARAIYRGRVSQFPAGWSCCATEPAFWREAIDRRPETVQTISRSPALTRHLVLAHSDNDRACNRARRRRQTTESR
jgi:hypothetical protein